MCIRDRNKDDMPRSIKRACTQVIIRIAVIFCVSLFMIGLLVPYNSPYLMGSGSAATHASPYVVALTTNGVKVIPHIVNAVSYTHLDVYKRQIQSFKKSIDGFCMHTSSFLACMYLFIIVIQLIDQQIYLILSLKITRPNAI